MDSLIDRFDAWVVAVAYSVAMLTFWGLGRQAGHRSPPDSGQDPGMKFTEASMAILGLLLAFTFAMSLGRHDHRSLMVVAESNAIGDFYTSATLLKEPQRSALQGIIREYTQIQLGALSQFRSKAEEQGVTQRSQDMQGRMTDIVAQAVAEGTPIAMNVTNALNAVTSAHASRLAAYEETLPLAIELLLLLACIVPSFLVGVQQGAARRTRLSGTLSFIILVTLLIFIILDLNQARRGLINVNREPFERLVHSIA